MGQGLPIIGKLLGHSQLQTTARYAHLAADPVIEVADLISERLARSLQASTDGSSNDVKTSRAIAVLCSKRRKRAMRFSRQYMPWPNLMSSLPW